MPKNTESTMTDDRLIRVLELADDAARRGALIHPRTIIAIIERRRM